MTGSGKRTRQRHLAKVARQRQQTRAMAQRKRRMQVGIAGGTAAALVIAIGAVFVLKPAPKPVPSLTKTPTATPAASPTAKPGVQTGTVTMQGTPPKTVACGGSIPPDAGKPKPQFGAPPKQTIDPSSTYTAVMSTSCGTIEIKLDPVGTPIATNNFVFLADKHFYDGIWFHRIVKGFMVQGGDPLGTGGGGPGYQFNTEVNQTIKFGDKPGVLAYANSGPNTNGSQFFITVAPQSFLDTNGPYTAFGTVTKGMDVLQKIADLPAISAQGCASATEKCRTTQAVYINSITIKVAKAKPSPPPTPPG
jgi:cyclophilin family peptidyl-prolyl cis-trans isomerase